MAGCTVPGMESKTGGALAPNRLAVYGTALSALVAAVVSLLGGIDSVEKALVVCVALVVAGGVAAVWLRGWQAHEQRSQSATRMARGMTQDVLATLGHRGSTVAPLLTERPPVEEGPDGEPVH